MATPDADQTFFDHVRRSRIDLEEQIRLSKVTIEESWTLLREIDEMIAKAVKIG